MSTPEEHDEWRYFSDGAGDLKLFCPDCPEREFGITRRPRPDA
jgi:hypothetical protein